MGRLVVSRLTNESVQIADNITIKVVEIRPGKVRLMIEAPNEIPIYRTELLTARHHASPPIPRGASRNWHEVPDPFA